MNKICEKIVINAVTQNDPSDCSTLKISQTFVASNPPIFVVWLLKHLIKLWSSGEKLVRFNFFPFQLKYDNNMFNLSLLKKKVLV